MDENTKEVAPERPATIVCPVCGSNDVKYSYSRKMPAVLRYRRLNPNINKADIVCFGGYLSVGGGG